MSTTKGTTPNSGKSKNSKGRSNKNKGSKSNLYTKLVKVIWGSFVLGLLGIALIFFAVRHDFLDLFGGMPPIHELDNPKDELSSELYAADGVLLGKYYLASSNRTPITFDELPETLTNTLLAAEDIRFYDHPGIDLRATLRAFSGIITNKVGGGSTLTQQLSKNLFKTMSYRDDAYFKTGTVSRVIAKIKEWILSVILETKYTKKEIMAMYLNTVAFGNNSFGIKVASKTYFNLPVDSLNYQQSAVLVGLVNAPSRYNPNKHPDRALAKRNRVLNQLEVYDFLSKEEVDSITQLPLVLQFKKGDQSEGPAPYFRAVIGNFLRDWARDNGYDLYQGGLKIYTTLDSRMQKHAEAAVNRHMNALQKQFNEHWKGRNPWIDEKFKEIKGFLKTEARKTEHYRIFKNRYGKGSDSISIMMNTKYNLPIYTLQGVKDTLMSPMDSLKHYKRFLNTGFMAMEPQTGKIKAWVGGINHKFFKYDHVKQGRRQPGSTFKPFVYTAAVEAGWSPCAKIANVPVTFNLPGQDPPVYRPENSGHEYDNQELTLREAMARSVNQITAYLMKEVGPENVVAKAHLMGVKSPLDPVPALCLGVSPVSVYEMVGAYCTFANKGISNEPIWIDRIEDKNGNIVFDPQVTTRQAMSEEDAYVMLHILRGTAEISGGTALGLGYELRGDNEIGGKTGTTQNASDGWFMGVTQDLVAGCWVGGDNRSIHFRTWTDGQGARTAMPIYKYFMQSVYKDDSLNIKKRPFEVPRRRLNVELDCEKYKGFEQESDSLQSENTKRRANTDSDGF